MHTAGRDDDERPECTRLGKEQRREAGMHTAGLGRLGEEEAARYLGSQGWTILDQNVRWGRKEVDLIASKGKILAFVEVKCRRGGAYGDPLEAITPGKRREIAGVARHWLRHTTLPPGTLLRFDAISIRWPEGGRPEIRHVPDAWRLE